MIARRRRQSPHGQGGFALVELIVVVAIFAVLAGVVVFAVGAWRHRAHDEACRTEKRTLQTAVQAYRSSTGYFPSNEGILVGEFLESRPDGWDYEAPVNLKQGSPSYTPTTECQP